MGFDFEGDESTNSKIRGETFEVGDELVICLHFESETLTDADEDAVMVPLRRFVAEQKKAPVRYHMILDTHRILTIPVDRIMHIYEYLGRKEKYLRDHSGTVSYIVQGRLAEAAIRTVNGMFDTWADANRTFQCYPTSGECTRGIPAQTYASVVEFIGSEGPRKAP